ncbi:helix-turn-helix transcriptional regulator [Streptomyces sp. JJ36]|uniref:helix-turn-helix domain-containing protein n=1 Tax=Streptomyces sp. JJ36 TaxID=2736645 RepID=UPI001F489CFC|nr:helix-turn-helix transcriptional regulator [Streptomyces sp. JJ36]MCF6526160.1 helix-turn-helix transcriptional regulator [Streptomyces sp. JJ36]
MGNGRPGRRSGQDDDRPTAWCAYGKLLRLFRDRAGMTQQQLGDAIGYSLEQVGSVEQGRRPAKAAFTEAAEEAVGAGGALRVLQEDVDRAKLPAFFRDFALLESEAVSRFSYDPLLVPGLLQTEDYARVLFAGHCPPLSDETVERHVEARLARQRLLDRTPLVELCFVIGESALTNPVGGSEVLRTQLQRLLAVGRQRNVEIQVMPAGRGFHTGLDGPFVLLETSEQERIGYVESQEVGCVVTDGSDVTAFGLRYGKLRAQALTPEESAKLIDRLAGEA